MYNSNWRVSRYSLGVAIIFFLGIFLPSIVHLDGMSGGYAFSTLSGFFLMIALVTAAVFASLAHQQDKLFAGKDLLAHWTYTIEEWRQYFAEESVRDSEGKKWLFYVVVFWSVLFGIAFPIFDRENGIYISYVMFGLIILIGIVAFLSIRYTRHQLEKHGGEAWIGRNGAFIAGQMHSWTLAKGALLDVIFVEDSIQPLIQIDYLGGNTQCTVRIPVPEKSRTEAIKIVQTLVEYLTQV